MKTKSIVAITVLVLSFIGCNAQNKKNEWSEPLELGEKLNMDGNQPRVSPDGEFIFFVGNNVLSYWVSAKIIAWPLAWYSMSKWLQNFAYHTDINFWYFIIAGSLTLFIALLSISFQTMKAANSNPIECLKYE